MSEVLSADCPDDLVEAVEDASDKWDVSRSEAIRELLRTGVEESDDVDERLTRSVVRSRIKERNKARQFEAHFRRNVVRKLNDCWKGDGGKKDVTVRMKPDEARNAVMGYRDEAEQLYGEEKVAFVDKAVEAYREAYNEGDFDVFLSWLKGGRELDLDDDGNVENGDEIPDDADLRIGGDLKNGGHP